MLDKLHQVHKMQDLNRIERAIQACTLSLKLVKEPDLKRRINTYINVKTDSFHTLLEGLRIVRTAAGICYGDGKYIEVPDWVPVPTRPIPVDDYFVADGKYITIGEALSLAIGILTELNKELTEPHNENFTEYYNNRAHHLYSELINIAIGVSENV